MLVIGEFEKKARVTEDKEIIPKTGFSMGKETIFILVITGSGLALITWVVYKAKQNSKPIVKVDDYDGYEVEDQYWDVD